MFIIENIDIPKKYFKQILKISKIVLFIAFAVILIQQVINPNFFIRTDLINLEHSRTSDEDRLLSIYSWLDLLAIGFSFVPVFILVIEENLRHKKSTVLWLIAGLIFSLLCKSRWVMVNTMLVGIIYMIYSKNLGLLVFRLLILAPLLFTLLVYSLKPFNINIDGIIMDRVFEKRKGGLMSGSASTRILAFKAFDALYWQGDPVFGKGNIKYGMGGSGEQDYKLRRFLGGHSSQIHVGYLSLFYMYGIVGGAAFIMFLILLFKRLYQDAKITKAWAPMVGMLGFAVANLTLVWFSVFEMGFIIVLLANKYYKQELKADYAL
ncbi:hypothetical protein LCM02_01265 [Lutimonas saemankumensis]|uniref:O-antigen ligase family protein n=1 Tax=Lutimonas saemankumensis TaxID=483016 RepID=UPI001CD2BCB2|nr:hypothetical protein [Lutimonas saemankumensis]MCA0931058.1 hypothetical protein [Lutimonas saemankumensis]